jgi:hypothetical protein
VELIPVIGYPERMPYPLHPFVLKAVYERASELIRLPDQTVPTELIASQRTIFRAVKKEHVQNAKGDFDPKCASESLLFRNEVQEENRFSGPSFNSTIPAFGALYFSTQQQAQVSEIVHYARYEPVPRNPATGYPIVSEALSHKCILRVRISAPILTADISLHNVGTRKFFDEIAKSPDVKYALRLAKQLDRPFLDHVVNSTDCSVARGIGLAVANSGYLKALQATTARTSERSPDELGDNIIFFGHNGEMAQGLRVEEAYFFPIRGEPIVYKF